MATTSSLKEEKASIFLDGLRHDNAMKSFFSKYSLQLLFIVVVSACASDYWLGMKNAGVKVAVSSHHTHGDYISITNISKKPLFKVGVFASEGAPLESIEGLASWFRDKYPKEKERAEAIFQFFVENTFDHLADSDPSKHLGHNPLILIDSFGYGACDDAAFALEHLWEKAGLDARVHFLVGHVVPEVFYENKWHIYDPNIQIVVRDDNDQVLSRVEITENLDRLAQALAEKNKEINYDLLNAYATIEDETISEGAHWYTSFNRNLILKPGETYRRFRNRKSKNPFSATPGSEVFHSMATLSYRAEESYWSRSVLIPFGGIHPILGGSMNIDYDNANFYLSTDINDQWIDVNADELRNLSELIRGATKFYLKARRIKLYEPMRIKLNSEIYMQVNPSTFPEGPLLVNFKKRPHTRDFAVYLP